MSNRFAIVNAQVVLTDRVIERGAVLIEDGKIVAVAENRIALPGLPREEDAGGAYLIPGVIDLHNDSLETEINPRPNANLPMEFALANLERRLAASGVTTEFHAISFMNMEKSARTVGQAAERAAFLQQVQRESNAMVDHHVLHRLDVWNPQAMDEIFESVRNAACKYVSLNDHTPGQGQYRDVERYSAFIKTWRVQRGGAAVEENEVEDRMAARAADTTTIPSVYARVAGERTEMPFVLATHDDDSPEKCDRQWEIGAGIAEFPVVMEAAVRARERGMAIVVGAPNIVRGGSTSGNLDAVDLVSAGLADIICADYHAPSLLVSAFKLVELGLVDVPSAIRMLTVNPATAVGLVDRGAIEVGRRADLALVRVDGSYHPSVEMVVRGGQQVLTMRRPVLAGNATW